MKVSKKDLEASIVEINQRTESTVGEDEFILNHNLTGYRVMRRMGKGRGMIDISPRLLTKKEIHDWMGGFITGWNSAYWQVIEKIYG